MKKIIISSFLILSACQKELPTAMQVAIVKCLEEGKITYTTNSTDKSIYHGATSSLNDNLVCEYIPVKKNEYY